MKETRHRMKTLRKKWLCRGEDLGYTVLFSLPLDIYCKMLFEGHAHPVAKRTKTDWLVSGLDTLKNDSFATEKSCKLQSVE